MIGASARETVGKPETVMTELYDDVAEHKVQEKHFHYLQCHYSADVEYLASLRTGCIRVNHHVIEKTSILVDHDGEEAPGEDEVETHAKVENRLQ